MYTPRHRHPTLSGRAPRRLAVGLRLVAVLVLVSVAAIRLLPAAAPVQAATTAPLALAAARTPAAPTVVFQEGFENTSGTAAVALTSGSGYAAYVGAPTGSGAPAGAQSYAATAATTTGGFGGNSSASPAIAGNQGAPGWLPNSNLSRSGCNGWIAAFGTYHPSSSADPTCRLGAAQSGGVGGYDDSWAFLRALAQLLGQAQGQGQTNSNHVLSAYTNSPFSASYPNYPTYPAGTYQNAGTQFQTANTIAVTPGHYYVGSAWYAAVNCNLAPPLIQFNMLSGTSTSQALGGQSNVCTSAQNAGVVATTGSGPGVYHNVGTAVPGSGGAAASAIRITVPSADTYTPTNCSTSTTAFVYCGKGTNAYYDFVNNMTPTTSTSTGFAVAHIYSSAVQPAAGVTQVGLQMLNQQASGNGNDGAFDLPQLLDATPIVDKSFSPASISAGQTSVLTFTVTNTAELAAKQDFGFTDTLPAGLTLANTTIGGTCTTNGLGAAYTSTGTGGSTIKVAGADLAANQSSCTITATVTAATAGSYTNAPAGNMTLTGLLAGTGDTLTVTQPTLSLTKQLGGARTGGNDQFTVGIHTGSATGPLLGSQPNATTAGSGATITAGTGTTGVQPVAAGTTYYLTEVAAGSTSLAQYTATITCTDPTGGTTGLPTNAALPASGYSLMIGSATSTIACTITNTPIAPPSNIDIAKTYTGASIDPATGKGTATYQVTVTNSSASAGTYGPLTDTPGFSSQVTATGATWTAAGGPSGGSATGAGPYALAPAGTTIAGNATHTYTVAVGFTYATGSGSGGSGGASTLNPMAVNNGFTVFTSGNGTFGNSEIEGSIASGGNVTFSNPNFAMIHSSGLAPTSYTLPVIDGDPTRLMVGGRFLPGSSGEMDVSSRGYVSADQLGFTKIGDLGNVQVSSRGPNMVWIANGPSGSVQAIYDENQPYVAGTNPAVSSRVQLQQGFASYFAAQAATQAATTTCLTGLSTAGSSGVNVTSLTQDGWAQAQDINIVAGKTNVLAVPASSVIFSSAPNLILTGAPLNATTTLVIQVTGLTNGQTLAMPAFQAAANTSATQPSIVAPYTLWDFSGDPAGSSLTLTGSKVSGSIYAPGLSLSTNVSTPIEGSIFTQNLTTAGGEIHHYPFSGTLACGGSAVVTPPPSGACTGTAGSGLFNQVALPAGQENGSTGNNTGCGVLTALQLRKQSPAGIALDGSQWKLSADSGGSPGAAGIPTVAAASSTGLFDVTGLPAGTYWLTETQAPAGYALATRSFQFVIASDGTLTPGTAPTSGLTAAMITQPTTGSWRITATDVVAYQLPLLGADAAAWVGISGIGLVGAAAVIGTAIALRRRTGPQRPRGRHAA